MASVAGQSLGTRCYDPVPLCEPLGKPLLASLLSSSAVVAEIT